MHIAVIGAGLTGANAVKVLRQQGCTGDISLIGAEPWLPYERPPLSKGVLLGTTVPESVAAHDATWYADQQVDLRVGQPATDIDQDRRTAGVAGARVPFDRLLLATGATPRRMPVADAADVHAVYLRTLDDAVALRPRLSGHILIIGAGWIGLEVTSSTREAGAAVTVVERSAFPLLGILGPQLAHVLAGLHRERGVDLRLDTSVQAILGRDAFLTDGSRVRPDLIVVGIGVSPEDRLAVDAELATGNGVLVDAAMRTSDSMVFAAGDIANVERPSLGRIRVERWHNAIEQGRHAGRAMLGDHRHTLKCRTSSATRTTLASSTSATSVRGLRPGRRRWRGRATRPHCILAPQDIVLAGMHLNAWGTVDHIRAAIGQPADIALRGSRHRPHGPTSRSTAQERRPDLRGAHALEEH